MFSAHEFKFKPATPDVWPDLETLFSGLPACAMCWCMYWRKTRSEWWGHSAENKQAMRVLVESGTVPGILAYAGRQPVAWCSVAPRSEFPGLDRSPTLKRIDDEPVWSITCFAIAREYRRRGLTSLLAQEAIAFAQRSGAQIVEAYPLINEPKKYRTIGEAFLGFATTFERLGFKQASHRSRVRNIMRLYVSSKRQERR